MTDFVCAIIAFIGLLVFLFGVRRMRHGGLITGGLQGLIGLVLMLAAAAAIFVATDLDTYHRFTHETPVAEMHFKYVSPQKFRALLTPENGTSRVFELDGNDWQLDARVIKLKGWATLIGVDGAYRLERLSGRFHDVQLQRSGPHTVYSLGLNEASGLDTWMLLRRYGRWLPWVDASYGNAAYLPMADQAYFQIHVGTQGLIPRPMNDAAARAIHSSR